MSNLALFNQTITNERTQKYLTQVLGEKRASFVNNITALVSNSANLQECEAISVLYAGIKATALDLPLDPNLGFTYVIPYKDNKAGKTVAQFQIGYKGFIQLAMRSGQFKTINVRDVREGEITGEDFISGEMQFKKIDDNREAAKIIGYVAYFRLINGFEKMNYWTIEELQLHGKRFSQTFKKGFGLWKDDFDSMAKKTAIKLLLSKYAPLSIEMQGAIISDQAIINEKGAEYIDNQQDDSKDNEKVADIFDKALNSAFEEAAVMQDEDDNQNANGELLI